MFAKSPSKKAKSYTTLFGEAVMPPNKTGTNNLCSAQGTGVLEIAKTYFCSEEHDRNVIKIKKFNEDGLDSFPAKKGEVGNLTLPVKKSP